MKILFWDIDGTLIRTAKAGLFAFQEATRSLWREEIDFGTIQSAGMTDSYIAAQIIEKLAGRPAAAREIDALLTCYESLLPGHLAMRQGRIMPSVLEILEHFHDRQDTLTLLLTGNTRTGAQIKLTHYGLARFFDFDNSAFDRHCLNRLAIAASAREIAGRLCPEIPAEGTYIIGDTPNDIRCGKAIGARTIGVATGAYSQQELAGHQPWQALECLPSPGEFANILDQKN